MVTSTPLPFRSTAPPPCELLRSKPGSFLPTWTPVDLTGPVNEFIAKADVLFRFFRWADYYMPVSEGLQIFGTMLTLFAAAITWRGVLWVLTKLHIAGGE